MNRVCGKETISNLKILKQMMRSPFGTKQKAGA